MKTDAIYLKLPHTISKVVDEIILKEGYASKQEFIREAIRYSLIERRKKAFQQNLSILRKKSGRKGRSLFLSNAEKNAIISDFAKEKGWKL